jgi:hypothetical protein
MHPILKSAILAAHEEIDDEIEKGRRGIYNAPLSRHSDPEEKAKGMIHGGSTKSLKRAQRERTMEIAGLPGSMVYRGWIGSAIGSALGGPPGSMIGMGAE